MINIVKKLGLASLVELFSKTNYRQKALGQLQEAQMALLKVQSEKLFAESMIVYYTKMIEHCNVVLSDQPTWEGHSMHSNPKIS